MDQKELAAFAAAIDAARDRADATLRLVGPGRRPAEVRHAMTKARVHLDEIHAIVQSVDRRELLRHIGVLGVAPLAPATGVRDALTRPLDLDARPPELPAFARHVADLWQFRQASRYDQVSFLLPRVLAAGQLAAREGDARANGLLALAYQCAAAATAKIGQSDLAWVAAERAVAAAQHSDNAAIIAASERMLAHAFLTMGRSANAEVVALDATGGLSRTAPEHLSVYGALLNTAAVAAARQQRGAAALQLLDEAEGVAERVGSGRNDYWTAFGSANVAIHRVSVAVEVGEASRALAAARAIDHRQLPLERQAHLLINLAEAHDQLSEIERSVEALLEAERLAPEEVRYQPAAGLLIERLLRQRPGADVLGLAARVGAEV